jgi:2-polyprenyl-3-methyl-5-hydroxy-6-metoxy-1,4-benzoquinol methylase
MNSVADHYNRYPYPNARKYLLNPKGEYLHLSACAPTNTQGRNILVVGCGSIEGILVANANPNSSVMGIDLSENQIRIGKSIRRKFRIDNLSLRTADITAIPGIEHSKYECIVATGVIHHIPEVKKALANIANLLESDTGIFSGMLYDEESRPQGIRELNVQFRSQNYDTNDVRKYFEVNNIGYAAEWYYKYDPSDEEIADTWLNPYFVEYSPESVLDLFGEYFANVNCVRADGKLFFIASNGKNENGIQYSEYFVGAFREQDS